MQHTISQRFFFDAAHTLRRAIEAEGSRRIHGHSYHAEVSLSGACDPASGMVLDLGLLRQGLEQVRGQLDHQMLDDVPGLGPPTLENLCGFIARALPAGLRARTSRVRVWREALGDSCTLDFPAPGQVPMADADQASVACVDQAPIACANDIPTAHADDTLAARSLAHVWHPCTQMKRHEAQPPVAIARAQGPWLYGTDGRRYLDGISSWWVNLFGHSHPHIKAALARQLEQLDHVMLAGFTHAPVVELSERLGALTGLGHAFYASDGAAATEIALKMSAHYWRNAGRPAKNRFVGLAGGYHGETVGALAVTDIALFRSAYAPLVRLAATVPSPDARAAAPGETPQDVARRSAAALQAWLAEHHASTAALIVEPLVQCAAGMAMHDPEYLRLARALCERHEVHLVVDEIAVGFGRTGSMLAHRQAGIRPDFVCLSKGLTGGTLPLSAVLTSDAVYAAFYDDDAARGFLHSHSYTGNPLACRAALATLDLFGQLDTLQANRALAARIDAACAPLSRHPRVRHARRLGMIWAWDIETRWPGFAQRYHQHALAHGLLLRPIANTQGVTLYAMPPYVLDEQAVQCLADGALAALDACLQEEAAA